MRLLSLGLVLLLAGCGNSPKQSAQTQADLMSIAMQYHQYVATHQTPPTNVEDLTTFKDPYASLPGNQAGSSRCQTALQSGDYVVIWSFDVTNDLARNESLILAYHKDVPTKGGIVAFSDGVVEFLDKDQFAATDKAKPNSPANE